MHRASIVDMFKNVNFWAPFCAWMTAQCIKMLCGFTRNRKVDFRYLVSTGGMPSAHTAMVIGLATSVGLTTGFDTPLFVVALALAAVVTFDASTVRQAAGEQARLLNEIIDEIFKEHRFSERKMAELLGHTRLEVLMGAVVGVLVAVIIDSAWILL